MYYKTTKHRHETSTQTLFYYFIPLPPRPFVPPTGSLLRVTSAAEWSLTERRQGGKYHNKSDRNELPLTAKQWGGNQSLQNDGIKRNQRLRSETKLALGCCWEYCLVTLRRFVCFVFHGRRKRKWEQECALIFVLTFCSEFAWRFTALNGLFFFLLCPPFLRPFITAEAKWGRHRYQTPRWRMLGKASIQQWSDNGWKWWWWWWCFFYA